MVNLDKWQKVEHLQVEVGDQLKIVEVDTMDPMVKVISVYKVKVNRLNGTDIHTSDGSVWALEDVAPVGEDVTIYRRKPKSFEFPRGFGALISARSTRSGEIYEAVHIGGGNWIFKDNGLQYVESLLRASYEDFTVLAAGV